MHVWWCHVKMFSSHHNPWYVRLIVPHKSWLKTVVIVIGLTISYYGMYVTVTCQGLV